MASDWSFRGIGGGGKGLPPPLGFSDHHVQVHVTVLARWPRLASGAAGCNLVLLSCCDQPDAVFQSKDTKKGQEVAAILQKKAWEKVAFQPLFMTAFMLWMSGKNITIFSIITVAMACMRPVQALLSMNKSTCASAPHTNVWKRLV